jgi:hypothetical protein
MTAKENLLQGRQCGVAMLWQTSVVSYASVLISFVNNNHRVNSNGEDTTFRRLAPRLLSSCPYASYYVSLSTNSGAEFLRAAPEG